MPVIWFLLLLSVVAVCVRISTVGDNRTSLSSLSPSHSWNHRVELLMAFFHFSLFPVPDESYRWEVNRKRPNSPAVTLSLFPTEKNGEELISVDVVPALEVILLSVNVLISSWRNKIIHSSWIKDRLMMKTNLKFLYESGD